MNTYRMCRFFAVALLLSALAVTNIAVGDEPVSQSKGSLEKIIADCQAAKSNFRPLTIEDFKLVKTELVNALASLDARLKLDADNGDAWRKFLLWEPLQNELKSEGLPNKEVLNKVYLRYASGNEGLALVWFVDVQSTLRRMLMVMGAIDNAQTKTLYEQNLDKLAAKLNTYAAKPTTEDALDISESVRWLINARQTPELVDAVKSQFNQPNLYAQVSAEFVAATQDETVDDVTQIHDCILGTDVSGSGHTVGQLTTELVPDDNHAVLDMFLLATTYSKTVGLNGPVCIYSDGTTRIGACKRVWVNENGINTYPAVSNAVTSTCITDIQARRKIIERIAWKKAGKQLPKAEYLAARHAEQRVNERVDSRAEETLAKAQRDFEEKFRRPLNEHKLFPDQLHFTTDKQALKVVSQQIGTSQLAAPSLPPAAVDADMTLRIHESMINNFALDALGGMTVHEEKLQARVIDMLGRLPDKLKGDEDQEPWAITFARRQPISVTFSEDGFKITIRGSEYYKGEAPYPAMDVTAVYKIKKTESGFMAVRQGDIQIFPPGRQQVSGKEQIIRQLLMKRFGKVFEPEIVGTGLTLTGKLEKAGKMIPIDVQSRDGWLTIAWRRVPAEKTVN
jgi:hypothetical protein